MNRQIVKKDINRFFIVSMLIATSVLFFISCTKVEKEPPRREGTVKKEYKMPDPTPMTPAQREIYNNRNNEYRSNVPQ